MYYIHIYILFYFNYTTLLLYIFFFATFVLYAKQIINNCCLLYNIINQMFITRYKYIYIYIFKL